MKAMTESQWKQFIDRWKTAGPAMEKARRAELRALKYSYAMADALLDIGDRFGRSRKMSGLVEMQRWFMKMAERPEIRGEPVREKPEK